LANKTLALHLPGGRQLFVTIRGALWTQQRSSGVCYKRRSRSCGKSVPYFGSLANFSKSVSNSLVNSPVIDMESDSDRNVGRSDLSGKFGFAPAPRETDPTPAVTRPSAIPASAMVTRSRTREGRGIPVDQEVEFRPETEIRQEVNKPAEIPITCEGGFWATRSSDIASQY